MIYRQPKVKQAGIQFKDRTPLDEWSANQQQSELIRQFWGVLGGQKNNGFRQPTKLKLELLVKYAAMVMPYKKQQVLRVRRKKFDKTKKHLHNLGYYGHCFLCSIRLATLRHHIIQLQNGGINSKKNLVSLCTSCHAVVHPHLRDTMNPNHIIPGVPDGAI